jgi:hypothetical protein
MPVATFSARNVWIYEGPTGQCIAGFRQRGTTSNRETYFYMSICFTDPETDTYSLVDVENRRLEKTDEVTPPGHYWVASLGSSTCIL